MAWTDKPLRLLLTTAHNLLKVNWLVRRPRTFGAHALALTPERKIVLVKLRYVPGWRLPGGGRGVNEDAQEAVIRELREEIGLISHGKVRLACELDENADFRRDLASLFIVEDVRYAPPRWSWEIERIIERSIDNLPAYMSPRAMGWLAALRGAL
jgi:8-oxo-dGTP pyrophosphatase MutT (NUDIX family)